MQLHLTAAVCSVFKVLMTLKKLSLTSPNLFVCVRVSLASDSSETIEVIVVKLGTVTASDVRMHHVLTFSVNYLSLSPKFPTLRQDERGLLPTGPVGNPWIDAAYKDPMKSSNCWQMCFQAPNSAQETQLTFEFCATFAFKKKRQGQQYQPTALMLATE